MKSSFFRILLITYLTFLASILALTGLGFLIAGLFLYLSVSLVPWIAGVITGVIILAAILVVFTAGWLATRQAKRQSGESKANNSGDPSEILTMALKIIRENNLDAKDLTLYALMAGGILGASPELRKFLISLLVASKNPPPEQ